MINDETRFMKQLEHSVRVLLPAALWTRHNDRFLKGVADVEINWNCVTTWMEVKYIGEWGRSKLKGKLIGNGHAQVSLSQLDFLASRCARGVNAFAIFGVKEGPLEYALAFSGEGLPAHIAYPRLCTDHQVHLTMPGPHYDLRPWLTKKWAPALRP